MFKLSGLWEPLNLFGEPEPVELGDPNTEIRISKLNFRWWDAEKQTGFLSIFDKWFGLITCRFQDGKCIETIDFASISNSQQYIDILLEKLRKKGYNLKPSFDLEKDFWVIKGSDVIALEEPLPFEINLKKWTIKFDGQEPMPIKSQPSPMIGFDSLDLVTGDHLRY